MSLDRLWFCQRAIEKLFERRAIRTIFRHAMFGRRGLPAVRSQAEPENERSLGTRLFHLDVLQKLLHACHHSAACHVDCAG
jgi:hypothetical protein